MAEKKKSKGAPLLALIIIGIVVFIFVKVNPTDISDWIANKQTEKNTQAFNLRTSYPDFYKWITTVDTKNINNARWSYIDSSCGSDKSCYQESYKGYIKPTAFDYGSSKDNDETMCPAADAYSYICSRFGDMLTHIRSAKSGVDTDKNYSDAEAIYNQIALTKG